MVMNSTKIKCVRYLGKMYFLPKIHKKLDNAPGSLVRSKFGTPTENTLELLGHHLKPLLLSDKSHVKEKSDIFRTIKELRKVTDGAILVTDDVVGLYLIIPL